MSFKNIIDMIGKTPILELNDTELALPGILMKIEGVNPAGSIKDRAVLGMIEYGIENRMLKMGDTLIEPTSGNTGIAMALIGSKMGFNVKIVMPETMTSERRSLIKSFGAELILTDGNFGMRGSIDKSLQLLKENKGSVMLDQFSNPGNGLIHYKTTANEIISDIGQVDYFVCGVGTGGTISGVARKLKETYSGVKVIAVEPSASAVLSGHEPGAHRIQGIGPGFVPVNYDESLVDEIITVSDEEAISSTKLLLDKFGVFAGISTGANYFASNIIANKVSKSSKIVTISPDGGMKYMSLGIY